MSDIAIFHHLNRAESGRFGRGKSIKVTVRLQSRDGGLLIVRSILRGLGNWFGYSLRAVDEKQLEVAVLVHSLIATALKLEMHRCPLRQP